MPVASVALKKVALPEFGEPTVMPKIPLATYEARIEALLARGAGCRPRRLRRLWRPRACRQRRLSLRLRPALRGDAAGHPARQAAPKLLVGNEGWGYAEIVGGPYERVLYQTFSLPGQPRDRSACAERHPCRMRPANPARRSAPSAGSRSARATTVSTRRRSTCPPSSPTRCARWSASAGRVVNAADLMMDPADGLRAINEADQLAAFEFAATFTSQGVRNVLANIEPGMTELQAARLIGMNGLPHCCHPMLTAGKRAPSTACRAPAST